MIKKTFNNTNKEHGYHVDWSSLILCWLVLLVLLYIASVNQEVPLHTDWKSVLWSHQSGHPQRLSYWTITSKLNHRHRRFLSQLDEDDIYGVLGGDEVELVSVDVCRLAAEHSSGVSNDRFFPGWNKNYTHEFLEPFLPKVDFPLILNSYGNYL